MPAWGRLCAAAVSAAAAGSWAPSTGRGQRCRRHRRRYPQASNTPNLAQMQVLTREFEDFFFFLRIPRREPEGTVYLGTEIS